MTTIGVLTNTVEDLGHNYGAVLVSTIIGAAFWGITCLQTLMYFETYESDSWYLKNLVILLWILDTLHEILCIRALWFSLISQFGDIINLSVMHWELIVEISSILFLILPYSSIFKSQSLVAGFVANLAQGFFTWRIWRFSEKNHRFSKSWILLLFLMTISLGQLIGFIFYTAKAVSKPRDISFLSIPVMANLSFGLFVSLAVIDIVIAVTMCTLLWKGRTSEIVTDRLLVRLISASASTGTCTAVFSVFASIARRVWPDDLFYLFGALPLCTLYCNAVLANLNSRKYIRGGATSTLGTTSLQLGTMASFEPITSNKNDMAGRNTRRTEDGCVPDDCKMAVHVRTSTTIS